MSDDGNSGGEGGFDLNAFGDWGSMYNVLGASGSGSSPGTQGQSMPAYQTQSFPIDAYYRPSGPKYGQTQDYPKLVRMFWRNTLRKTFRLELEEEEPEEDEPAEEEDEAVDAPPLTDPETRRKRRRTSQ